MYDAALKMPPKVSVTVRNARSDDLRCLVGIERNSGGVRYSLRGFKESISSRHKAMVVAQSGDLLLGYAIYSNYPADVENFIGDGKTNGWYTHIERLVVENNFRRHGIGSQLIWHLVDRHARVGGFRGVEAMVGEREVGQQLFLKSIGFHCTAVAEEEGTDDDYIFGLPVIAESK